MLTDGRMDGRTDGKNRNPILRHACVRRDNNELYLIIFNGIVTKKNQTSGADAAREIPTLGSTDNATKSINLVSGIIRLRSD